MYENELKKVTRLTELFKDAKLDFPLVVDQVAVVVQPELKESAKAFFEALTPIEWASDSNKAVGTVFGKDSRVEGELHFSYSSLNIKPGMTSRGLEFEILVYNPADIAPPDGGADFDNWHAFRNRKLGRSNPGMELSHFGFHLPSEAALEQVRVVMLEAGFEIAQEVRTYSHTNQFLVENGRKYHYLIFDTRDLLGFDTKFIARIQ